MVRRIPGGGQTELGRKRGLRVREHLLSLWDTAASNWHLPAPSPPQKISMIPKIPAPPPRKTDIGWGVMGPTQGMRSGVTEGQKGTVGRGHNKAV